MVAVEWSTWAVVYLAVLVAAALGLITLLVRLARRPVAAEAAPPAAGAAGTTDPEGRTLADLLAGDAAVEPYMAQFLHNSKGERVGETIGASNDRVVVKHEGKFFAVPAAQIRVRSGLLVADGVVDWDEAARLGEAWRESGHKALRYDESGMPIRDEPEA